MSIYEPLTTCDGELAWVPTSAFKRDSELRDGSNVYGRLEWQSAFRAVATASAFGAVWRFELEGFLLRQWIRVYRPDSSTAIAVFQAAPSFNGVVEFADGRAYYWDSNFWLTKWIWSTGENLELARVSRHLTVRPEGSVLVPTELLAHDDLPLLLLLGWYIITIVSDIRPG